MSIGSRIKERRLELGFTQPELAKMLGVSKGSVGNYECDVSAPNEKILIKLFDILKCDANFLYQDSLVPRDPFTLDPDEKDIITQYRTLDDHGREIVRSNLTLEAKRVKQLQEAEAKRKTASKAAQKDGKYSNTPMRSIRSSIYRVSAGTGVLLGEDDWETIKIPDTPETKKADFALTVYGNSMEPVYYDGDIVLVQQTEEIGLGEIGIFIINSDGYIKKYGGNRLISLNAEYEDILFNRNDYIKCCGRVIGRV